MPILNVCLPIERLRENLFLRIDPSLVKTLKIVFHTQNGVERVANIGEVTPRLFSIIIIDHHHHKNDHHYQTSDPIIITMPMNKTGGQSTNKYHSCDRSRCDPLMQSKCPLNHQLEQLDQVNCAKVKYSDYEYT